MKKVEITDEKIKKLVDEEVRRGPKYNRPLRIKKPSDTFVVWQLLAFLRVYLAYCETSYIHPDEFHQSLQVVAYDVLDIDSAKPWDYTTTNPIRSVIFSGLTAIPFLLLQGVSWITHFFWDVDLMTPNALIVSSRMFMTLLSFVCDMCVYKIAQTCYIRPWQCVEVFAGSYVMLVYATRTFSNCLELILFSIILWRVSLSIVESNKIFRRASVIQELYDCSHTMRDKVRLARLKTKLPPYNYVDSVTISVVVTMGFFIRPTFLIFALVPVAYWLQRGVITKELEFKYFNYRFLSLVPGAIVTFAACILADSFYYKSLNFSEFAFWNVTASSFTVTPFNFLMYNLNGDNLAEHGLHPYLLHILVNIPLLFGVLGVLGLFTVSKYLGSLIFSKFPDKPKVYSLAALLLLSFFVPVMALSMIPHQEPRFLLPVLPPLVILFSDRISLYNISQFRFTKHWLCFFWQMFNILGVVFYGFLHQGGVTKAVIYVHDYIAYHPPDTSFHVYFSHMYSPPTFLLMRKIPVVAETEEGRKYIVPRTVTTYNLGSSQKIEDMLETVRRQSLNKTDVTTIFCISASMSDTFKAAIPVDRKPYRLRRIMGHVSMETPPDFSATEKYASPTCNASCQLVKTVFEFSVDVFIFNSTIISYKPGNSPSISSETKDEL